MATKHPTPVIIKAQYEAYKEKHQDSFDRAKECVEFVETGCQWDEKIKAARAEAGKETLVANESLKHLRNAQEQCNQIKYGLNLTATNDPDGDNIEETNAFKMILSDIMTGESRTDTFRGSINNVLSRGRSVLFATYAYESSETLNKEIVIKRSKDNSTFFFDPNAQSPCKEDGAYFGFSNTLSGKRLVSLIPSLKGKDVVKKEDNVVIDYFYRVPTPCLFIQLTTGVFKREDLLESGDVPFKDPMGDPVTQKGNYDKIYFQRICNEKVIVKPQEFPIDDVLPIAFEYGLTVWTEDKGEQSFPFSYFLQDSQRLYNYVISSLATTVKASTADKYLLSASHVEGEQAQKEAQEINSRAGAFIFDGDPQTIVHLAPNPVNGNLLNLASVGKSTMDSLSGAMMTSNPVDGGGQITGVGLDKLTALMNAMLSQVIKAHIHAINVIGKAVRQMIPKIYTEQRTLVVADPSGGKQSVQINVPMESGNGFINNIRDINSDFHYEITASVDDEQKKEVTLNALQALWQADPATVSQTADIYVRNLDIPDGSELERRISSNIPLQLIEYSQGKISDQQFQQWQQQQQAPQQQVQQLQMQLAQSKAQNESLESQVKQFDAQTKRQEAQTKQFSMLQELQIKRNELELQATALQSQADSTERDRMLEAAKTDVSNLNAQIKALQSGVMTA
jgi:hypothetical protein